MFRLAPIFLALALSTSGADAHEFWIDAGSYRVERGDPVVADLKVGQEFEGVIFSYLPATFRRFDLSVGEVVVPVEGRMGDRPALNQPAPGEGLAIAVHVTRDSIVSYDDFAIFEAFVRHKDAAWVLEAHAGRGLPDTGFREGYSRYAKSLVAVGGGSGADREFGLETELVLRANPYTDDLAQGLPVDLFYKGGPRAGAQIEMFERAPDGEVAVTLHRTDAAGRAVNPVRPGHVYMLDAVVLREPEGELAERPDIVWESLWANVTFAVPE